MGLKLVVLERDSVGTDVDLSCYEEFGEVDYYKNTLADQAGERVKDADVIIANKTPLNEKTLAGAEKVKLICEFATGYDNVDLEYCRKRGITVCNVRNYSSAAVAQHTVASALYLLEHLPFYDDYVKSGAYGAQDRFSNFDRSFWELEGKTWGIVGMGNIGRRVAEIAAAFGCHVIFYSASGKNNCQDYERVELNALLSRSDVLSIHCPLTERTRGLIDLAALRRMKREAILINVARGPVVNNADLYTALEEGSIAAAGLDVLEEEPITAGNPLSRIQDSCKLLITPHMAWASTEARNRLAKGVYENIRCYLQGKPQNVVNP